MNKRLTDDLRRQIANNATLQSFSKEELAIDKMEEAVSDIIYRMFVSPQDEADALKAPKLFIYMGGHISGRVSDGKLTQSYRVYVSEDRPMPPSWVMGTSENFTSNKVYWAIERIRVAKQELHKKRSDLQNEVRKFLYSFTTVKALLLAWPEGRGFIPQEVFLESKRDVPAIMVSKINRDLTKAGISLKKAA